MEACSEGSHDEKRKKNLMEACSDAHTCFLHSWRCTQKTSPHTLCTPIRSLLGFHEEKTLLQACSDAHTCVFAFVEVYPRDISSPSRCLLMRVHHQNRRSSSRAHQLMALMFSLACLVLIAFFAMWRKSTNSSECMQLHAQKQYTSRSCKHNASS